MRTMCLRWSIAAVILLTLFASGPAPGVDAATDYDSLAAAIQAANSSSEVSIMTLTADITLSEALPAITGTITIEGNGHTIDGDGKYRIFDVSGGRLSVNSLTFTRGAAENGGAIRLRDGAKVTVTRSNFNLNEATNGGAISMVDDNVSLSVDGSGFVRNSVKDYGGAIHALRGEASITSSSFVKNKAPVGGAIYASNRKVSVANSTFSENQSGAGGGALDLVSGEFTLTHLTFEGNRSGTGTGSAINRISGRVYLRNSILADGDHGDECEGKLQQNVGNLSRDGSCLVTPVGDALLGELTGSPAYYPLLDDSPALDVADPQYCLETDQLGTPRPQGGGCDVGAIESTSARRAQQPVVPPPPCPLADRIIAANTDAPSGGCRAGSGADIITLDEDIRLWSGLPAITSDITIEGNGHTISGNKRFRIFNVDGGKLTVNNLTLTEGWTRGEGGAIEVQNAGQAIINNSQFSKNFARLGGAVALQYPNTRLTINNSRFHANHADSGGGAISNWSGAAIIRNSSFVKNFSSVLGGAVLSASRGATDISSSNFIDNWSKTGGAIRSESRATTTVINSTFIGNSADSGGAVYTGGADTTLTHVTISGGGVYSDGENRKLKLRNSIINTGLSRDICRGGLAQNVGNLISDGSCDPALRGNPLFGERTDDQAYLLPQEGSPAINAADGRFCLENDQRGVLRPQGAGCDIGAIEWPASGPPQKDPGASAQDLSACTVTTTDVLNFRDGPGGAKIGIVAKNATLTALDRTPGWFQVEYRGRNGWISRDYVTTQGECE